MMILNKLNIKISTPKLTRTYPFGIVISLVGGGVYLL